MYVKRNLYYSMYSMQVFSDTSFRSRDKLIRRPQLIQKWMFYQMLIPDRSSEFQSHSIEVVVLQLDTEPWGTFICKLLEITRYLRYIADQIFCNIFYRINC